MIPFIKTETNLTFFAAGKTKVVPIGTPAYDEVMNLIRRKASDADILSACDLCSRVKLKCHASGLFFTDNDGQVWVGNDKVAKGLSDRIVDFVEQGLPFEPLIKLWNNIMSNPDPRARVDLYEFLQHNGHPITEDGYFIAYKRVRENFKDHWTNTIDNSVGANPYMDRSEVDCDPSHTCSRGLHVACLDYALNSYQNGNGRLIAVKVHPRDVCAIPPDYNKTKMRTCGYFVHSIHELDVPIKHSLVDDKLAAVTKETVSNDADKAVKALDDHLNGVRSLTDGEWGEAVDTVVSSLEDDKWSKRHSNQTANKGWQNLRDSKGRFFKKRT